MSDRPTGVDMSWRELAGANYRDVLALRTQVMLLKAALRTVRRVDPAHAPEGLLHGDWQLIQEARDV